MADRERDLNFHDKFNQDWKINWVVVTLLEMTGDEGVEVGYGGGLSLIGGEAVSEIGEMS